MWCQYEGRDKYNVIVRRKDDVRGNCDISKGIMGNGNGNGNGNVLANLSR